MGTVLIIAAVIVGLVYGCVPLLEKMMVFRPTRALEANPAAAGLHYEDVEFRAADGARLHGWWVPAGARAPTLLLFHGNAGNISHRVELLARLHRELGANVFIFDYRGYGRSEGRPSEQGTYRDGEAAWLYLRGRADLDPEAIVLYGRSLGSAVAVDLAVRKACRGVILEAPFTSAAEMARTILPLPGIGRLVRTRYDSLGKIKGLRVPQLVLHGDRDEVVPYRQGRRLYEAAPGPKEFYTVRGAGHNDTYLVGGRAYFATLKRFLAELPEKRK